MINKVAIRYLICDELKKKKKRRAFKVNMGWQLRDAYKTAKTEAEHYSAETRVRILMNFSHLKNISI